MSERILLHHLSALDIREEEHVYCGGDQEWYAVHWRRQAGCGPTNCANLLWYLAQTREGCGALCPYDAAQKTGFMQLMEEVWDFVTPGNMGVNTTNMFVNGAKRYGDAKGIALAPRALAVGPLRCGRAYKQIFAFVTRALERDLPVAFLNLSNGTLDNLDSWHWVTIVALRGDEAMVYDQGKAKWVGLRQWLDTSMMGGGFVSVEPA